MLRTRCIKTSSEAGDGIRISVMSRHTLNDGVTPDTGITPELFDIWVPELAPPPSLIGAYYNRGLDWEGFTSRYLDFTHNPETEERAKQLAEIALNENITLLCVEATPEQCHRRLLAERLQELTPDLVINIR